MHRWWRLFRCHRHSTNENTSAILLEMIFETRHGIQCVLFSLKASLGRSVVCKNSLYCETVEVFYRDFLSDRLPELLHLVNVDHGIHLLNVLGIQVSDAETVETCLR